MSNNYKTECPRCHTIYPMPANKLDDSKARANCGKCGHTFYLNLHLIEPKAKSFSQKLAAKAAQAPKPQARPVTPPSAAPASSAAPTKTMRPNARPNAQQTPATTPKPQARPQASTVQPTKTPAPQAAAPQQAATPSAPSKKRQKPQAQEGMIFDSMDTPQEDRVNLDFSADELDNFLRQDVVIQDTTSASGKNNGRHTDSDEAWLDDLLKNDDSPDIKVVRQNDNTDDLSDIIGEDLDELIPKAQAPENPKQVLKKIQDRLHSDHPTQEQIFTKRSALSQIGWLISCFLMLGLAGVQYVFFNQERIAKNPEDAALVRQLCPICTLPSADTNAFTTSSRLLDGPADFSTDLIGNIQNQSAQNQLYPNIKIRVVGGRGVIGELILAPKEYLAYEQKILPAHQNGEFMITLDIPKEDISAISIEPFY